MLALLLLIDASQPGAARRELESELRRAFKASGKLRDLQVVSRSVSACQIRYPEVTPFLRHLERLLARQQRHLMKRLRVAHPRRIERAFRCIAAGIASSAPPAGRRDPLTSRLARELARSRQAARAAPGRWR